MTGTIANLYGNRKVIKIEDYIRVKQFMIGERPLNMGHEIDEEKSRTFRSSLNLDTLDAQMILYCLRINAELLKDDIRGALPSDVTLQRDYETVQRIMDKIQGELKHDPDKEGFYVLNMSLKDLELMYGCVDYIYGIAREQNTIFSSEPGNPEDYMKWLEMTYYFLSGVYTEWRCYVEK